MPTIGEISVGLRLGHTVVIVILKVKVDVSDSITSKYLPVTVSLSEPKSKAS